MLHVANLTNGLACAPSGALITRIESTACEQKRWTHVLRSVPDHVLYALASGESVVVHDQSERARATRAQWQGLSLVRYVLRSAWGLPERREAVRNGLIVNDYWRQQYGLIEPDQMTRLRYYRRYVTVSDLNLAGCECPRIRWHETGREG